MDGKVFISLVVGVLALINASLRAAGSHHLDWQFASWLISGAIFLASAYVYWRRSRAQGS